MSAEPPASNQPGTSGPPPPPGPNASHEEWHEWRRQQRRFVRAQWMQRGWDGAPWPWFGSGWFWGGALVLLGIYFLLSNIGWLSWLRGDVVWPVLLILFGVWLIVRRGRWWP